MTNDDHCFLSFSATRVSSLVKCLFLCTFIFKSSPDGFNRQPANPLAPCELGKFKKNLVAAIRILGGPCFLEGILGGLPGGSRLPQVALSYYVSGPRGPCLFLRRNGETTESRDRGHGRGPLLGAPHSRESAQSPREPLRVDLSVESSGWLSPCVG